MKFTILLLTFICSLSLIAAEEQHTIADMKEFVRHNPDLQVLSLAYSQIDHLELLSSLSNLRVLDLSGCIYLSDDALASLTELKNLEVLSLS